ncbi:MAG: polysaccharide biosynthesis protein [Halanaerobiales bacterium]|nr:polysaccharide biosynthesis protein [Halanaerobiales bacterium]
MNEKAKTNFVKGAAVLTVAGIISRFIGLIYRIPLTRLIGAEGVGLYQMAYPIYTILLVISISGIPVALAKLVSEKIALGQWQDAYRTFRIARRLSMLIGGLFSIALFIGARLFVDIFGLDPRGYYTVVAISPAIFVVSIMASYRGFFQGMQNMVPTAYSQVLEQVTRMIIMLGLAYVLLPYGIEISAAGATFSATTGAIVGYLVLIWIYFKDKKERTLAYAIDLKQGSSTNEPVLEVVKRIASYAIPVTFGALVVPLMSMVDLIFVPQRLQVIGFTVQEATALYGELTGVALVLVHFPGIITTSLQISLIPSISTAFTLGQTEIIKHRTSIALRYALMVGLPSAVGLFILAEPLCSIIFDVPTAAVPLRVLAWGIIFIALQQSSSGILQGVGKVKIPARNLLIGAIVNAFINYTLTAIPQFGIKGAAFGTVMGFGTAAILNLISLRKAVHFPIKLKEMLLGPAFAAGIMGVIVFYSYHGLYIIFKSFLTYGVDLLAMSISVFIGMIAFFILLLLIGVIKEEDLSLIPGMRRLISPLKWMRLLKS